ncbi:sulfatase [Pedobacter arcticus]|uniref:sulfatase n=1 Tax=Pedobacter arcticus TaxID=752140 RepID=UPI0003153B85|nr:sulfatase [Pedobacter arcticus]
MDKIKKSALILFNCFLIVPLLLIGILPIKAQSKKPKNILFICVDDLRPELKSFGISYIKSPNIDKLAATGRPFFRHYVNAPSCGPSRAAMLTGVYGPYGNEALFERANYLKTFPKNVNPTLPEWFRNNGYTTVSVGKVSHHPGGLGGDDWNDPNIIEMPNAWDRNIMPVGEWEHPRGAMHGLANGEIRVKQSDMAVFQSAESPNDSYPDDLIAKEGIKQLEMLANDKSKPFFLVVGLLKPHLPFGAPKKYYDLYRNVNLPPIFSPQKPKGPSTWFNSAEFMNYNRWGKNPNIDTAFATEVRKHYAACVSYADAQVGLILKKLKDTGADKNTIVVLWGDHGWNLGEHQIWGKHNLYEEALRSPLIVKYPSMPAPGKAANGIIETIDIFPTLCELTNITKPAFLQGQSFKNMLVNPNIEGHFAYAYTGNASTVRTPKYRFTLHNNGDEELYDETTAERESLNIAKENQNITKELKILLVNRLKLRKNYEVKTPK